MDAILLNIFGFLQQDNLFYNTKNFKLFSKTEWISWVLHPTLRLCEWLIETDFIWLSYWHCSNQD